MPLPLRRAIMFVPVNCTNCGKPFQVPETTLGKLAPCPWCQAVVTALPVSAPQSDPQPAPDAPATPVLELPEPVAPDPPAPKPPSHFDERAPKQKLPVAQSVAQPPNRNAQPAAPAAGSKFTVATFAIGFAVIVVAMCATVFLLGYRSGRLPEADWTEFTPPDGSFTVAMPGQPTEADVEPVPEGSLAGGKRYAVRRWYARTEVWVAYNDLEPGLVAKLAGDRDRVIAAGVLRVARDREVARLEGTVTKEAEIRRDAGWGVEVHMDAPSGPAVVQLVLMGEGPRPRLYVYGVQGKNVTPTNPACRRLFASFRVNA